MTITMTEQTKSTIKKIAWAGIIGVLAIGTYKAFAPSKQKKLGGVKKKISKHKAFEAAKDIGIDFNADYHTQSSYGSDLAALAKRAGYRKPQSASGSTGRYFFEYLKKKYA